MRQQQQPSEAAMLSILACTVLTNFACISPGVVTGELSTLCQMAKVPDEPGLEVIHSLPAFANKDTRQTQEV